jgi:O-succinylbenzoate synthase
MTMVQLVRISLREIHLPLKEPFRISSGVCLDRRIMLLELEDADGAVAWSECVAGEAPNYTSETIDTAWIVTADYIVERMLGVSFNEPDDVHPALELNFRGHHMAKAAIEMGMWALFAEKEQVSLAHRLGGTRAEIATGISLGIQDSPAALVERVGKALAQGYRKVKLKIEPGRDIDYVRAVREAFPDAPLMADANNAYTLADTSRLALLDAFNLMMIEQPLSHDDLVRHSELQRALRTPICLDESITSVERAEDMLTLGSGRIINIKPGRVGGFQQSRAIHDLCVRNEIPVWCGGMLESGIGRAYNVALASLAGFTKPGDVSPSARYWAQDVVTPEWTMSATGMVRVPTDRPGIGVTVNVDRIDDLTVRTEAFVA